MEIDSTIIPPKEFPSLELPVIKLSHAKSAESDIFILSGLNKEDFEIFDVPIKYRGSNHIHTFKSGKNDLPKLVIIHGYGGSSVTFFKMIKTLSQKFEVFCIDLLGMGLSSRPKFDITDSAQSIEFFVESIEEWRKTLDLKQFFLCGHSLGGYIAINYTLKYQKNVRKLFLISPAGVTNHGDETNFEASLSKVGFMRRQFLKLFHKLWKKKYTPSKLFQKTGFFGRYLLKLYITKRWGCSAHESEVLQHYFKNMLAMPESSEGALFNILRLPRARAVIPMEDLIKENIKIPVVFCYGDRDWMDYTGAKRLSNNESIHFFILKDSGHHVNIDNPKDLCNIIIEYALFDNNIIVFDN